MLTAATPDLRPGQLSPHENCVWSASLVDEREGEAAHESLRCLCPRTPTSLPVSGLRLSFSFSDLVQFVVRLRARERRVACNNFLVPSLQWTDFFSSGETCWISLRGKLLEDTIQMLLTG